MSCPVDLNSAPETTTPRVTVRRTRQVVLPLTHLGRTLSLLLVALVFGGYAHAATCDSDLYQLNAGEWCQIAGSDLRSFIQSLESNDSGSPPYYFNIQAEDTTDCNGLLGADVRRLDAYSGASWDSTRQELIFSGGGHNDHCDNGVYTFNVEQGGWRLAVDRTAEAYITNVPYGAENATYADGTPIADHAYDIGSFVPSRGEFCRMGVVAGFRSGVTSDERVWCVDVENRNAGPMRGWENVSTLPTAVSLNVHKTAWDRRYGRLWVEIDAPADLHYWDGYDWTTRVTDYADTTHTGVSQNAEIDPLTQRMWIGGGCCDAGKNYLSYWDLTASPPTRSNVCNDHGLCLPTARQGPGIAFNSRMGKMTVWTGGPNVHLINDSDPNETNWTMTTCSMTGSAPDFHAAGMYGRFAYSHKYDAYVILENFNNANTDNGIFIGKLAVSPGCGTAATPNDIRPEIVEAESPGYKTAGIRLAYGGDDDEDAAVAVRYRTAAGPGAWVTGNDMLRLEKEMVADMDGDTYHVGSPPIQEFQGMLYNLTPDTKYEVELTITDPDGFGEIQTVFTKTRGLPPANPQTQNTVNVSNLTGLRNAVSNAAPGDVIVVAPGTYTAGAGDGSVIQFNNTHGTADNPIFIRGANREATILDAGSAQTVIDGDDKSVAWVTIEDLTLQGPSGADFRWAKGLVIRRNIIKSTGNPSGHGIRFRWGTVKDSWIYDNWISGGVNFPTAQFSSPEGITFTGSGNVIFANTLMGFADAFSFSRSGASLVWPADQNPSRGNEIFLNDVFWNADDCFEFDYSHGANIAYQNRCSNAVSGASYQPSWGHNIAFRNVIWSTQGPVPLKTQTVESSGGSMGANFWNNTIDLPLGSASSGNQYYVDVRNNLMVGPTSPEERSAASVIDLGMRWCADHGGENTGSDQQCVTFGTVDYNFYNYDAHFRISGTNYDSFAATQVAGWNTNSQIATLEANEIFTDPKMQNFDTSVCGGTPVVCSPWNYHNPADARIKSGTSVNNNGAQISGFTGATPDIGAIEQGAPLPAYGTSWGPPSNWPDCSDGLDNDSDGDFDLADSGCPTRFGATEGPPDLTPPSIPQNLASAGATEDSIELLWNASNDPESGIAGYRVYRDGVQVAQTSLPQFSNTGLPEATTFTYAVSAVNGAGLQSGQSVPLQAGTAADTTSPALVSASALNDGLHVMVVFSEPVEELSANDVSHYAIDNGIAVSSASLQPDLVGVLLGTSAHAEGAVYLLTVNDVRDRAATPNTIPPNSQISYSFTSEVVISDVVAASGRAYETADDLAIGSLAYIDRDYTYGDVPTFLLGAQYIRSANDDKLSDGSADHLSFDVNRSVTVYVAHDDRYETKPQWLDVFQSTAIVVPITGSTFTLFQREFPSGTVTLGGNVDPTESEENNMYTVIVVPSATEPPLPPSGLVPY